MPLPNMPIKNKFSLLSIGIVYSCILYATLFYYPKWNKSEVESVISWDVAGYYQYLPATFIYKDLQKAAYLDEVLAKYKFTPENQQSINLPNGNKVMKYAMGQAVMFSPFFAAAHLYARNTKYLADGFSTPYQIGITIEILFFALLGLWFLRLILLRYFSDGIAAMTLLGICLGSNYFEYASMTGAMTHNNLFALYAILIYCSIRFYEKPSHGLAIAIGSIIGLAALTRPTEVVAILIPLMWGISYPWKDGIKTRWTQLMSHKSKFILIGLFSVLIGMWQLIYWKYVSGDWLIYSYGKEGFDWLRPHIEDCMISMKAGWLVYSPLMILSLIGLYFLYRYYKSIFPAIFIVTLFTMYVAFSWQTWWYGGSLGQRALIQYYPLLAFPFAATIVRMLNARWSKILLGALFVSGIYYNLWLSHQVHKGGLVYVSQMTRTYFWKVVGRYDQDRNNLKFLDTNESFGGSRKNVKTLYSNNFENDIVPTCHFIPIEGKISPCLSKINPVSPEYFASCNAEKGKWIRVRVSFYSEYRVWAPHEMGKLVVVFYKDSIRVKDRHIKYHRQLLGKKIVPLFIDVKCPDEAFDQVGVKMNNGAENNIASYDLLIIESFH